MQQLRETIDSYSREKTSILLPLFFMGMYTFTYA